MLSGVGVRFTVLGDEVLGSAGDPLRESEVHGSPFSTCLGCALVALQASHEAGHDDDGQHLHRPLRGDGKKVIAHRPADFGKIGIGSAQLNTNPQIGGQ
jgi:hypothetical protein